MSSLLEKKYTWEDLGSLTADRIEKYQLIKKGWNRKKFLEWFMIRKKLGYLFDWKLIARAYKIWTDLNTESDHFTCIVGSEGSGKSTLAVQFMSWISPNAALDDITYTMNQFISKMSDIADDYHQNKIDQNDKSIVMDEGAIDLFSRESMKKSNRVLAKTFFVQRFLNVHVIICIPRFQYLDSVIRDHRVKTLISIFKRGKCKVIVGQKGFNVLNTGIKKEKNINHIQIPYGSFFQADFSKEFPHTIDKSKYENFKYKNIVKFLQDAKDDVQATEKEGTDYLKVTPFARKLGVSTETVRRMIYKGKIKAKRIEGQYLIHKDTVEGIVS